MWQQKVIFHWWCTNNEKYTHTCYGFPYIPSKIIFLSFCRNFGCQETLQGQNVVSFLWLQISHSMQCLI